MAITRRSLIKATVAAGVGGAVAGVTESEARGRGRGRGRRRRRRRGVPTTYSATGPFGYTPFTATFELPAVQNDALVDPDKGTIHSGIELDPSSGTPATRVEIADPAM